MSSLPILRPRGDEVIIVDVDTGEQLSPHDATDEQIARWRRAVLDWEQAAKDAKRAVDAVVIARMDQAAEWTVQAGRFTLSAPSPAPTTTYPDPEGLRRDLLELPDLAPHAVERAVKKEVSYSPVHGGIKKLRSLRREDVDAVLDRHSVEVERNRYVSVKEAA